MSGLRDTTAHALGKALRAAARVRGGGSAYPGLAAERIAPGFTARSLTGLPRGVVVISGTNGKTTTTRVVTALLEASGLRVFTNRTGSNFVRGVASQVIADVPVGGRLADRFDVAVLELDEAHAVHFVADVPATYSLLLNVMRDQLDRFGEIDTTARKLAVVAQATTEAIVANRDDPRLVSAVEAAVSRVAWFGHGAALADTFPTDDALYGAVGEAASAEAADVELVDLTDAGAAYAIDGAEHLVPLQLTGAYNALNSAAALSLARQVLGAEADTATLLAALAEVTPAFGRGEKFSVEGSEVEIVLVKNPGGFRLALTSYDPAGTDTAIVINDHHADGRDMSWLWDVDFSSLAPGIALVAGTRSYDMAVRLLYDEVEAAEVAVDLAPAIARFARANPGTPKRIYCTYTAMLEVRRALERYTTMEAL